MSKFKRHDPRPLLNIATSNKQRNETFYSKLFKQLQDLSARRWYSSKAMNDIVDITVYRKQSVD